MSNIYIIDDEEAIAELMQIYLQELSMDAQIYTNGLDFFKENLTIESDSLIILDLKMPEIDGIEVIRLLAQKKLTASLILVSGYDTGVLHSAEQLAQAHNLNVIGSLVKPVEQTQLTELLKRINEKDQINLKTTKIQSQFYELDISDLQTAIDKQQLVLYFQPQINIETGHVIGAEALVRWQHEQYGLISPARFIPLAERHGLMDQLTQQVMSMAVNQISQLISSQLAIPISVNVSAENINSLSLPEFISRMLQENKLDPTMLVLEITETALMCELVTSLDILTRLRMKGFDLSIDDFGTGYSSLSHLHRIPFTELKIDQSFVNKMDQDDNSRAIVKTCIMLGHELNMSVIAEGVETKEVLELLSELGCDNAQGYYIARPMPSEQFMQWLQKANSQSSLNETQ